MTMATSIAMATTSSSIAFRFLIIISISSIVFLCNLFVTLRFDVEEVVVVVVVAVVVVAAVAVVIDIIAVVTIIVVGSGCGDINGSGGMYLL